MRKLFTEQHDVIAPRVKEELDDVMRKGLVALVRARIDEEWFGDSFPEMCADGRGNAGCNRASLETMMKASHVIRPADQEDYDEEVPSDGQVFDLMEFSYEQVSEDSP